MKKTLSKNSSEFDKFGKEFIDLLSMNQFQKIFRLIENFDGKTPETLLEKIKTNSIKLKKPSVEEQKSFQGNFLNLVHSLEYASQMKSGFEDRIKDIEKRLEKDSRYSQLLNLISKADENVEFVSLPFLMPFLDFNRNFLDFCKPIRLLEEINGSSGEERKNSIVDIFKEIPEPFYFKYLQTIWGLSFIAENKKIPKEEMPESLGNLVSQSANRLKNFPSLVISEMGLLRNSFFHKNFEYIFQTDSFVIWDKNKPRREISADELVRIANDATLMCVEIFPLVAQLYLLRNFCLNSGLLDICLQNMLALTSGNASEISKAENEILAFGQLLTEPMRTFF